ncbi:hypothetical protein TRVL_07150 [Trypanosoma vivax]|nr:hypothetical protein TRVL_07150 [Trypanosoma vivax]
MQRGEVRRRASILLKREGCPEPELTAAGDHGDRTPAGSATLERVMKEELEGLELWLRASRGATSPFLPCHPATGLPVSTARKRSPAVVCDHRECERLHARAFALVSALLIHLYPMQQVMLAMEPKLWEGALYNLKKTLWERSLLSFGFLESLAAKFAGTASSDLQLRYRSSCMDRANKIPVQRGTAFECFSPCSNPLKNLLHCSWYAALELQDGSSLHQLRHELLVGMLKNSSNTLRLSYQESERAASFRMACNMQATTAASSRLESSGPAPESFNQGRRLFRKRARLERQGSGERYDSAGVTVSSTTRGQRVEGRKVPFAPGAHENSEEPSLTDCYEYKVLEAWREGREAVIAKLARSTRVKTASINCDGLPALSAQSFHPPTIKPADPSVEELPHPLRRVMGERTRTPATLLSILWLWVKRHDKQLNSARLYVVHAMELVIYTIACESHCAHTEALFNELGLFLQQVAEGYLADAQNFIALQQVPMPLFLYLVRISVQALARVAGHLGAVSAHSTDVSTRALKHVATLLLYRGDPSALPFAINILSDRCSPSFAERYALFLLREIIKCSEFPTVTTAVVNRPPCSHPSDPFIVAVVESLTNCVCNALREIPVRQKRPLQTDLSETLWDVLFPVAVHVLRSGGESFYQERSVTPMTSMLQSCYGILDELVPRWFNCIVMTRRRWVKKVSALPVGFTGEYEADHIVAQRVVLFASFIEGLLKYTTLLLPSALASVRKFSSVCAAAGVVLYDVDHQTAHEIMKQILILSSRVEEMDITAHLGIVRCLGSMRYGCTMWEAAVQHYTSAVRLLDAPEGDVGTSSFYQRPRVSSDMSTATVLRCVGSCPLPRAVRCMLTLRVIAFACAAGIALNGRSISACMHNFIMRRRRNADGVFSSAAWCDVLEWYNNTVPQHIVTSWRAQDAIFFHMACVQALLAQRNWPEALVLLPAVNRFYRNSGNGELPSFATVPYDFHGRVAMLLTLCAVDRTRSCDLAAASLRQLVAPPDVLPPVAAKSDEKVPEVLTAFTPPTRVGDTPIFRPTPPFIPEAVREEQGKLSLRLGCTELSYNHMRYTHDGLVKKLLGTVSQHNEVVSEKNGDMTTTADLEGRKMCSPTASRSGHAKLQKNAVSRPAQVRERVSQSFPLLHTVWSGDTPHDSEPMAASEQRGSAEARSDLDTRLVKVLAPLRRLERIRREKWRQQHPVRE